MPLRRVIYAWAVVGSAPLLTMLWTWPAGAVAMLLGFLLGRKRIAFGLIAALILVAVIAALQTIGKAIQ